ncbi:MAG: hypothetical protein ACOYVK_10405 [Bacillota bacterium]
MLINDVKGMYKIKVDPVRRVVYEYPEGLWRGEDFQRLQQDYETKIAPALKGKPWAKLSDLRNYKMSNIVNEINDHVSWAAKNGLSCAAIVVESTVVKMQMKRSGGGAMAPEPFTEEAEADAWLKQQGF